MPSANKYHFNKLASQIINQRSQLVALRSFVVVGEAHS